MYSASTHSPKPPRPTPIGNQLQHPAADPLQRCSSRSAVHPPQFVVRHRPTSMHLSVLRATGREERRHAAAAAVIHRHVIQSRNKPRPSLQLAAWKSLGLFPVAIRQLPSDQAKENFSKQEIAYKIMRSLEEDFGEVSLMKVLSLVNRFLTEKMSDGSSVNEHMNKLSILSEELKIAGYPFQEEVLVMVSLNSLPNTWEQFKISFCPTERTLNMCILRHHLLLEEDRKKSQGKEKNSYTTELHLGEYKNQGNKRNFQRKKDDTDLREKINRKRDREYRKESDGRHDKGD
ncbi:hypothetical protein D1007_10293 [Hordeum vulgare]|nr:hypothetical protein D1007_10293 [Hordeum vulgare]